MGILDDVVARGEFIEDLLRGVKRRRPVELPKNYALTGLRFTGKSTLLIQDAMSRDFIIVLGNLVALYGYGPKELLEAIRKYGYKRVAFDEVHLIEGWDSLLTALYNEGIEVIATGSSKVTLESSPDFARRFMPIRIHTLTALERYYLKTGHLYISRNPLEVIEIDLGEALEIKRSAEEKLIALGGFPASLKLGYMEVFRGIQYAIERTVTHDSSLDLHEASVMLRCIAEKPHAAKSCFRNSMGTKRSNRELNNILRELKSLDIIFDVRVPGGRHRYFTDPGIARVFGLDDIGMLLEEAVAYAFYSRGFIVERPGGREKTEIDFIVRTSTGKIIRVEVKHGEEMPSYSERTYVFYGGLKINKVGRTKYIPRWLIV